MWAVLRQPFSLGANLVQHSFVRVRFEVAKHIVFVRFLIGVDFPIVTFTSLHMKIGYISYSNTVYNMLVIRKNELKIELQKQHQTVNATSDPSSDIEIVPIQELEAGLARKAIHLYD